MNYNKLEEQALYNNDKLRKEQIEITNKINRLSQRFNDICNEIKENNKIILSEFRMGLSNQMSDKSVNNAINSR